MEDKISELSDDILSIILSYLTTLKEAARTSILSRRWRYIWKVYVSSTSRLCLDVPGMKDPHFGKLVDQISMLHKNPKLDFLRISFSTVSPKFSTSVGDWLRIAIANKKVENLEMEVYVEYETEHGYSYYEFPYWLFTKETGSSVKSLFLKSIFFKPYIEFNGFSSLISLKLENVSINDRNIVSIMFNCSNLEKLILIKCPRLSKIQIAGRGLSLRLKYLGISYPYGAPSQLEQITIDASNLSTLDYCGVGPDRVSFLYINTVSLVNVRFTFFSSYSGLVPTRPSFIKSIKHSQVPLPATLKHLVLFVPVNKNNYGLWGLVTLLQACPDLHTLELHLLNPYSYKKVQPMRKPFDLPHLYLKEFKFGGFSGIPHELEFISYLTRNAKVLEKITIINKSQYNNHPGSYLSLPDSYDYLKEEAERVSRCVSYETKEAEPIQYRPPLHQYMQLSDFISPDVHQHLLKVIPSDVELIYV